MAFTKIAAAGIGSTELVTLHSLEVLNNATVGGVLTYEDVTNVDSIGLITARNGVVIGSGITLSKDGDIFATGITTVSGDIKVGSGITLSPDGHSFVAGVSTIGTLSVSGIVTGTGAVDPSTGTVTSSGNMTVGGDLIIPDTIAHTGDLNTKIRFPANDQISFETAGTLNT